MKTPHLRDLDAFDAELEENRRQIAARREGVLERTGHPIDPNRRAWLRRQILKSVSGRR